MKIVALILVLLSLSFISAEEVKVSDTSCVLCEFIIKTLEDIISDNATQQQIISTISRVCDILPRAIRTQCKTFVQENGAALIQIIVDRESPHSACQQLGLCSDRIEKFANQFEKVGDNMCPMCQLFVNLVENYLADNNTIAFIEWQLHNFPCALLPGNLETQCDNFVDQYVPQIIQWIQQNESPTVFCKQVGLCALPPRHFRKGKNH